MPHIRQTLIGLRQIFLLFILCVSTVSAHKVSIRPEFTYPEPVRCLAEVIYFEARNQPLTVQFRVGQVVLNRVKDTGSLFPDKVCPVVSQRRVIRSCQFSWMCKRHSIKDYNAWLVSENVAFVLYTFYYSFPVLPDLTNNALYFVKFGTHRSWMRNMSKSRHGDVVFLAYN